MTFSNSGKYTGKDHMRLHCQHLKKKRKRRFDNNIIDEWPEDIDRKDLILRGEREAEYVRGYKLKTRTERLLSNAKKYNFPQ